MGGHPGDPRRRGREGPHETPQGEKGGVLRTERDKIPVARKSALTQATSVIKKGSAAREEIPDKVPAQKAPAGLPSPGARAGEEGQEEGGEDSEDGEEETEEIGEGIVFAVRFLQAMIGGAAQDSVRTGQLAVFY